MMATMDELRALHEIMQLKYRYMRGIDTHDWQLLTSCFAPDAMLWPSKGDYVAEGRDTIVELLRSIVNDGFVSSHIATLPEIELIGQDRARALWKLEDIVFYTTANPVISHVLVEGGEELRGAGYYHDDYLLIDGEWKMSSCGYIRIYEQIRKVGENDAAITIDPQRGLRLA